MSASTVLSGSLSGLSMSSKRYSKGLVSGLIHLFVLTVSSLTSGWRIIARKPRRRQLRTSDASNPTPETSLIASVSMSTAAKFILEWLRIRAFEIYDMGIEMKRSKKCRSLHIAWRPAGDIGQQIICAASPCVGILTRHWYCVRLELSCLWQCSRQ